MSWQAVGVLSILGLALLGALWRISGQHAVLMEFMSEMKANHLPHIYEALERIEKRLR